MSARKIAVGSLLLILLWFVLMFVAVNVFGFRGTPDSERLITQAAPAVEALQRYHVEHGRFPDSLEQAGVRLPETAWGPWQYRRFPGSESCELAVGDYKEDGFVVFWYSDTGWGVDR